MLNNHIWLVATVLDNWDGTFHISVIQKALLDSIALE